MFYANRVIHEISHSPMTDTDTYWFRDEDEERLYSLDAEFYEDEYSEGVRYTVKEWIEGQMAPLVRSVRHTPKDEKAVGDMIESLVKQFHLDTFPLDLDKLK